MSNPFRCEAALSLGGERITLRLTLGALAELETAFGVEGLAALGARMGAGKLSAKDLIRLLGPLARGGGGALSDAALAARIQATDLPDVVEAIAACFDAAINAENRTGETQELAARP